MIRILITLLVLASFGATAQAQHFVRGLDVVNHAHAGVSAFFASRAGDNHWDADLLQRHALLPNHFVQLDLDDPSGACRFDLKIVFSDGTSVVRRNVDVCRQERYTLTD